MHNNFINTKPAITGICIQTDEAFPFLRLKQSYRLYECTSGLYYLQIHGKTIVVPASYFSTSKTKKSCC